MINKSICSTESQNVTLATYGRIPELTCGGIPKGYAANPTGTALKKVNRLLKKNLQAVFERILIEDPDGITEEVPEIIPQGVPCGIQEGVHE